MNVVICDDEQSYVSMLEQAIHEWACRFGVAHAVSVISFHSGIEMLDRYTKGLEINVLFIDIQFQDDENGIHVVQKLHRLDPGLPVIFVTNYGEYVYEGYTVNAFRFLRKPILQADIDDCMNILWHQHDISLSDSIVFKTPQLTLRLPANSILYLEAQGHMMRIKTTNLSDDYHLRVTFKKIIQLLPKDIFAQCHRSYTVNIQYVRRFTHKDVLISNGDIIPVSRLFMNDFAHRFQDYYQGRGLT